MKFSRNAYLRDVIAETVVVHETDGVTSIRGVLVGVYSDVLVLEHAQLLASDGEVSIDGQAIIQHAKVKFMQRLTEAS